MSWNGNVDIVRNVKYDTGSFKTPPSLNNPATLYTPELTAKAAHNP